MRRRLRIHRWRYFHFFQRWLVERAEDHFLGLGHDIANRFPEVWFEGCYD